MHVTDPASPHCPPKQRSKFKFLQSEDIFVKQLVAVRRVFVCTDAAEKVARLHASKFGNVQRSVSTFADLSVALGAAPCHVQRVHFWHLKSAYFLETRWGPPLIVLQAP